MRSEEAEPSAVEAESPATATKAGGRQGLTAFRSLRYADFRILWIGTLFGSSGMWIQQVTLSWLTFQLTGSAFLRGVINGFRSLPLLLLGPLAGVAADRGDRKRLMLMAQVALMITAAILATIIVTGQLQLWHLFVFALLTGIAWVFNMPVRQSVVVNLVPEEDLMNALGFGLRARNLRDT